MREKWWRKKVPKDDGMVKYGEDILTSDQVERWAKFYMGVFSESNPHHWSHDDSYNWADEIRRKRCDTATRLQVNKRT